jgi:hypothetical protein
MVMVAVAVVEVVGGVVAPPGVLRRQAALPLQLLPRERQLTGRIFFSPWASSTAAALSSWAESYILGLAFFFFFVAS